MPMPPPTHIDSTPNCLSWYCSELISVLVMRAPVMPNGWPTAIAPPLTLSLSSGMPSCLRRAQRLDRERLVDLEQVDVVEAHAGVAQRGRDRLDRAEAHDLGRQAGDGRRHDARQRGQAELLGLGVAHDDHGRGAVVERAGVAGRDGAVGTEHRLEAADAPRSVVPARGPSSALTTVPSGSVTGVMSLAQKPSAMRLLGEVLAADARTRPAPGGSCRGAARRSRRSGPSRCRGRAGSPASRGSVHVSAPPSARLAVRAMRLGEQRVLGAGQRRRSRCRSG